MKTPPIHRGNGSKRLSRRRFVTLSLAAGLAAGALEGSGSEPAVVEQDVEVQTPDGTCDAVFVHPSTGAHPGVLLWPDSNGLRPVFRQLAARLAAKGYSVLVPNHLYRMAKAPVFNESFNPVQNPADMDAYRRITSPFFAAGAAERDASAYLAFLDAQRSVARRRKIGVHGYCLGGIYMMKTAALFPDRVGAGVSFHGGNLVTDRPDSPHLLALKIKGRLYFAIASDDDRREPDVKDKLKTAFAAARGRVEIEVYEHALHGWCVPDSRAAVNPADAERAWNKLLALYESAL